PSFRSPTTLHRKPNNLHPTITTIIHQIALPPHIKPYIYFPHTISILYNHIQLLPSITKLLYPHIPKKYNTTP
ncbi:sporulation initiation factor Spo0A C-terminal domain-containing protein, partial [Bacillus mycoides]|uniref:sporulation initiation factor Spo0A C-terminal domain-containing protein n=1 Tax=Bacillus mycoides TaxID=1405 RepID=UPI0023559A30